MEVNKRKAIALYSGGLDSILAIKIILDQDIEVIGVYFKTPFTKDEPDLYGKKYLNISILIENISNDFLKILFNPKHGFGKNINPCIDCRILMFQKAGELMAREKASFIISGEVLGQRPMTQNKKSLLMISEESGYGKYIVRPLSALLLPETEVEKQNIVDRSKMMDIEGRSRKRQIAIATQWGIKDYPTPAGGCKLTEPGFARRMRDLLDKGKLVENDIELLKVGRHFNLQKYAKLIVGRNERENRMILTLARSQDYLLSSEKHKGPISLLRFYVDSELKGDELEKILDVAGKITARYCDKEQDTDLVDINICRQNRIVKQLKQVSSLSQQLIDLYLI
jgi:tRNA U34 2-thiouridine synthase MnmA/TrmU